jgi:hypothetical protein
VRRRAALLDAALSARVVARRQLRYAEGPSVAADRPAHVRAASGMAWVGCELALVQDDANFVALVDPASGAARSIELPRGAGGRRRFDDRIGNKDDKLDLEAAFIAEVAGRSTLVALGSGARPARRRVVLWSDGQPPRVVAADDLYRAMEEVAELRGCELNLEGAALLPDGRLRIFQRGNGDLARAEPPVDATWDVSWPRVAEFLAQRGPAPRPAIGEIAQYDLGRLGGVRLTFTDAAWSPSHHHLFYLAAAERSPDAVRDGEVLGTALGVFDHLDGAGPLRFALLAGDDGTALAIKGEGLAFDPTHPRRALVSVDADDPDRPSELVEVALAGPWPA